MNTALCSRPLTGMIQHESGRYLRLCGFRPLTGMILLKKNTLKSKESFRPPYGDYILLTLFYTKFPPPYGDYIPATINNIDTNSFPPPYGDYILNISQPIEKRKSQKVGKCSLYCNAVNLHKKEQMQTLRL